MSSKKRRADARKRKNKKVVDDQPTTVEELVDTTRKGGMSRRGFIAAVTAAGATAGGAGILFAATRPGSQQSAPSTGSNPQDNVDLHDQHVQRQATRPGTDIPLGAPPSSSPSSSLGPGANEAHAKTIVADYHPDAVIEDVMHDDPIVGHEAIFARKHGELTSIADPTIKVKNRFAYGDQVVVEWEVSGTHVGDYLGFQASNRDFTINGITVVTRRDGKIVKESLYYDVAELTAQLSPGDKQPA